MKIKLIPVFLLFALVSCNSSENTKKDSTELSEKKENMLTYSNYLFLRETADGRKIKADTPQFVQGEQVYFVLENVGKFETDEVGRFHANLHMRISNAEGKLVAEDYNLFGEDTTINSMTKTGFIESPYAFYKTDETDAPGRYRFELIIVDKVAGDSVAVASPFEILPR